MGSVRKVGELAEKKNSAKNTELINLTLSTHIPLDISPSLPLTP